MRAILHNGEVRCNVGVAKLPKRTSARFDQAPAPMVAFDTTALEECLTTAVKSSLGLPNNEERLKQIIKVLTIMATNKGIAASALSAPTTR